MIGDTLADPDDVRPLPSIEVDDPAISMTIGTNTSPLIGKVKGHKLTARMVKDRLDRELVGNVSIKLVDIGRPDALGGAGPRRAGPRHPRRDDAPRRVRTDRRQAAGGHQDDRRQAQRAVRAPLRSTRRREHLGAITQLLAARKGRMDSMTNHGTGWVRMEFIVPSPAGSSGSAPSSSPSPAARASPTLISHGYEPWAGAIVTRTNGSIVADRGGVATPFAMTALQERMTFFVEPTQEVYEGMVVGENSRADDMDVNIADRAASSTPSGWSW